MAVSREKLMEKLSSLSKEDRDIFRTVLGELDPGDSGGGDPAGDPEETFTVEEIKTLKDILKKQANRKKGGILTFLDSLVEG